jgi:hypothetical protein
MNQRISCDPRHGEVAAISRDLWKQEVTMKNKVLVAIDDTGLSDLVVESLSPQMRP